MTLPAALALAAIIWLAYTAQAITGFGSTVVSITLAALFLPVAVVMPIAVALNLPFCGWLVWRNRHEVDGNLLKRQVLPLMLAGLAVGAVLGWWLKGLDLSRPLGALVLGCALLDLWRLYHREEAPPKAAVRNGLLLTSGFAQGFAASGGPLLAAALAGSGLPKARLRASLSVVWLITNTALMLGYVFTARYSASMGLTTLALLPVMAAALVTGDWLHHRVSERQFRLLVDLLLLASALALLL